MSMVHRTAISLAAVLSLWTAPAYAQSDVAKLTSCLDAAGVPYLTPSPEAAWTNASAAFNTRLSYAPAYIAAPTSAQQVSHAVLCGAADEFSINARGGHHSYASSGLGGEDGHFILDLSALNAIEVDGDGVASIGGGARLGDVYLALDKQGRALAAGVCPYVGIGGHAAYGGFGYFARNWGMVVDQISALEVVTSDGALRTVSSDGPDSDLFWALRGAGGSIGIITTYHLITHAAPDSVVAANYVFNNLNTGDSTQLILALQSFGLSHAPSEIGLTLNIYAGDSLGRITFSLLVTYVGSEDHYLSISPSLTDAFPVPPSETSVTTRSWIDTLQSIAGSQSLNTSTAQDYDDSFYVKSVLTPESEPLSTQAVSSWMEYVGNEGYKSDASNWFLQMELHGGASSAVTSLPRTATAYVHRSSLFLIQLYCTDYRNPFPESTLALVDGFQASLVGPMGEGWAFEAYQNYVDPRLSAEDGHALYYADNYARLQGIKLKYDPSDIFRIKPEGLAVQVA